MWRVRATLGRAHRCGFSEGYFLDGAVDDLANQDRSLRRVPMSGPKRDSDRHVQGQISVYGNSVDAASETNSRKVENSFTLGTADAIVEVPIQ